MAESMNTQEEKIAKKFTPETMKHIVYVTWPTISDKGDQIAWVDWKGDMQSGLFSSKIHLMHLGESEDNNEIILTAEGVNEKQPKLLSDGIHMMYLSDESGEFQVHIRNLQTNKTRQITTLRHGVLRYQLSDDEKKLVFEATLWPDEVKNETALTEMTKEEKESWQEELDWTPYVATNLTYKLDEWHGMRKGEFSHIGLVDLTSGEQKVFASGRMETMETIHPSLSHDGKTVAFYGYHMMVRRALM